MTLRTSLITQLTAQSDTNATKNAEDKDRADAQTALENAAVDLFLTWLSDNDYGSSDAIVEADLIEQINGGGDDNFLVRIRYRKEPALPDVTIGVSVQSLVLVVDEATIKYRATENAVASVPFPDDFLGAVERLLGLDALVADDKAPGSAEIIEAVAGELIRDATGA